ncbi:MAG TPA: PAC2 family protein [Candidatus Nanoarchaeia archaeon]|nr:PAC2 family protein [Candidatus Nanoarchaeia archaeon]
MEVKLSEKPKNPIILEGFPGVGLIGTITTEYLVKHLKAKPIGEIFSKDLMPMIAIHEQRVVQPIEIYYVKSKNLVILHALTDIRGLEWDISDALIELYKQLKAKEIISIEGIMGQSETPKAYYYTKNQSVVKKFEKSGATQLKEGVVTGVTAALLVKGRELNSTGIFVETHSNLPDSLSSAKAIEMLDAYLNLGVDYKPLEKAAAEFETKLKDYVEKMRDTAKTSDKKTMEYFG